MAVARRGRLCRGGRIAGVAPALLLLGVLAGPAFSQSFEAEEESVARRPRLDYESYGLALDPGLLGVPPGGTATGAPPLYAFSRLEVEGGHDSNVRRTATGETSSLYTVTRPGLSLNLDGETHETMLTGQAAIGRYGSADGDDYEDLEATLRSRLEVDDDLEVLLTGGAGRFHVERGSDLDLGPAFGTQTYASYNAGALVTSTAIPEFPISGSLQSAWYRFDDAGGVDRSGLDRWLGIGTMRVGVARYGEVSLFVQPGVQRVDYSDNSAGNPDSTRLDLALGATYSGGSVTQVSGFLGGSRRSFDQSGTSAELSVLAGLDAVWNPTDLMTVKADLSVANEDSELSAASSVTTTELGLAVDYEVRDNLIAGTSLNWTARRYDGAVADERLIEAGVGLRYLLNEYAYLGAGMRVEDQSSDDPTNDYKATVASLRLGIKLCCLRDVVEETADGPQLRQGVVNGVFR